MGLGYGVESNREHGTGRPDILLRDKKNRRALIIEAKKAEAADRMESMCDAALGQIKREQYWRGLDGYRTILCYGVAFYKKDALVKKECEKGKWSYNSLKDVIKVYDNFDDPLPEFEGYMED